MDVRCKIMQDATGHRSVLTVLFEGVDGCGKSTTMGKVAAMLRGDRDRMSVATFQDPGSTKLGAGIRQLLAVDDGAVNVAKPDRLARFLLYQAARVQTESELLWPAGEVNDVVMMDRWVPSTLVYQHVLGNIPYETVEAVVEKTTQYTQFDMAFYLKVSPETAVRRQIQRQGKTARRVGPLNIRNAGNTAALLDISRKTVEAYDWMVGNQAGWQGDHWVTVDGEQDQDQIVDDIYALVVNYAEQHHEAMRARG